MRPPSLHFPYFKSAAGDIVSQARADTPRAPPPGPAHPPRLDSRRTLLGHLVIAPNNRALKIWDTLTRICATYQFVIVPLQIASPQVQQSVNIYYLNLVGWPLPNPHRPPNGPRAGPPARGLTLVPPAARQRTPSSSPTSLSASSGPMWTGRCW